jgi:hypothetical protein
MSDAVLPTQVKLQKRTSTNNAFMKLTIGQVLRLFYTVGSHVLRWCHTVRSHVLRLCHTVGSHVLRLCHTVGSLQ